MAKDNFSVSVKCHGFIRRDGDTDYIIEYRLQNVPAALAGSKTRSHTTELPARGGYRWDGTVVIGHNITFPYNNWGFDENNRTYEIILEELPDVLKATNDFTLRVKFTQTGSVVRLGSIGLYDMQLKSSSGSMNAEFVITIPSVGRWEGVMLALLRKLGSGPTSRLAHFASTGADVEVNQTAGTLTYKATALVPLGSLAYDTRSGKAHLLGVLFIIAMTTIVEIFVRWVLGG